MGQDAFDSGAPEKHRSISSSLLVRVRSNDSEAWRRLTYLYEPVVLSWCRAAGLRRDDAEDVAQEVFQGVMSSIEKFRRDRPNDSFRGWLWTIARNKINDFWRKNDREPAGQGGTDAQLRWAELSGPDEGGQSLKRHESAEATGLYRRALDLIRTDFSENTWRAFWRIAVDDQPAADVAKELGMSRGAVYVAKSRVLSRLRLELSELESFEDEPK